MNIQRSQHPQHWYTSVRHHQRSVHLLDLVGKLSWLFVPLRLEFDRPFLRYKNSITVLIQLMLLEVRTIMSQNCTKSKFSIHNHRPLSSVSRWYKPSIECEFHDAITLLIPTSATFIVMKETQNWTAGSCRSISKPFSILTSISFIGYMTRWLISGHLRSTGRFWKKKTPFHQIMLTGYRRKEPIFQKFPYTWPICYFYSVC